MMTLNEQRKLLDTANEALMYLFDYIYEDYESDDWVREKMGIVQDSLSALRTSMTDDETYITLRDRNDGEVQVRHFDDTEEGLNQMLTLASKIYCFNDCDDTWEIIDIVYKNRDLYYVGWKPGMVFEYVDIDGKTVWERAFESWDH
jgi:hypothetical protein